MKKFHKRLSIFLSLLLIASALPAPAAAEDAIMEPAIVAESEIVTAPVVLTEPEITTESEPVIETEITAESEPVIEQETEIEPETVIAPEPIPAPESETDASLPFLVDTAVETDLAMDAGNPSGMCGDFIQWEYDSSNYTLTLYNNSSVENASTYDYDSLNSLPWNGYRSSIKKVIVDGDIGLIGVRCLSGLYNATEL